MKSKRVALAVALVLFSVIANAQSAEILEVKVSVLDTPSWLDWLPFQDDEIEFQVTVTGSGSYEIQIWDATDSDSNVLCKFGDPVGVGFCKTGGCESLTLTGGAVTKKLTTNKRGCSLKDFKGVAIVKLMSGTTVIDEKIVPLYYENFTVLRESDDELRSVLDPLSYTHQLILDSNCNEVGGDFTEYGGEYDARSWGVIPAVQYADGTWTPVKNIENPMQICQKENPSGDDIYGIVDGNVWDVTSVKLPNGNTLNYLLNKREYSSQDTKRCLDIDYTKTVLVHMTQYGYLIEEFFGDESFYKNLVSFYEEKFEGIEDLESLNLSAPEAMADQVYCFKTHLRDTGECFDDNYERYSLTDVRELENRYTTYPGNSSYMEDVERWNDWQEIDGMIATGFDSTDPVPLANPKMSNDLIFDPSWCNLFMVTPFLEDSRKDLEWTAVGKGTLYYGSGFDRPDTCKFSCDAKEECDLFGGCSALGEGGSPSCNGFGSDECSHCIADSPTPHCERDNGDCTVDSKGDCPGDRGDCWDSICKVDAKYVLQTDYKPVTWVGGVPTCSGDWHGIPYEVESFWGSRYCCPEGSDMEEIDVYPPRQWYTTSAIKVKKCVYPEGSVLGVTKFTIPDTDIDDSAGVDKEEIEKTIWELTHPAFTLTETGNMPFTITWLDFWKNGDEYVIARVYKPDDLGKEFIATSDLAFSYILDVSDELRIDAEHTYITTLRKDKHYVACDKRMCAGGCGCDDVCRVVTSIEYNYWHNSCGGISTKESCGCGGCCDDCCDEEGNCAPPCRMHCSSDSRIERETEFTEDAKTLTQQITIPGVSKEDILDNTQIRIEGVIDQFVDRDGYRETTGVLNITLDPDILSMFVLRVSNSTISYFPIYYPVKHYLYRKEISPGSGDTLAYDYTDKYGYDRSDFGIPAQCGSTCPPNLLSWCSCPADDPLDVTCEDISTAETYHPNSDADPDNDCVCVPNQCYDDPCISERSFHEEQGIRISNGGFEEDFCYGWPCKYIEYKNWKPAGNVEREVSGFSGYGVKLEDGGAIKQRIPLVPARTSPYDKLCFMHAIEECNSGGYLKLYVNENEVLSLNCDDYGTTCDITPGWSKQCVTVYDDISSIEFKANRMNIYLDEVNIGDYYDFVCIETAELSSMDKHFDMPPKSYGSDGLLDPFGEIETISTGTGTRYKLEFGVVNTWRSTLTADDFREHSNITIFSHFRDITVDLFPQQDGNPYVNVLLRAPSRIDYEFDTKAYLIDSDKPVEGTLKLYYYDTSGPIANGKIYVKSSNNAVVFLSPPSLVNNGYVTTDADGNATFSFRIRGVDKLTFTFGGNEYASPTTAEVHIGTAEFRSPFFRGDFLVSFLILILILIAIILSFRFFIRRKMDFEGWWKTLRGEDEE